MTSAKGQVVAVGSINADVTFAVRQLVRPGETVAALGSRTTPGGKSANQAVTSALLGVPTRLIATVGSDQNGELALREISAAGVDVDAVKVVSGAETGVAFICVDDAGENAIVLSPGANTLLTAETIAGVSFDDAAVVTLCFEVGDETVVAAARSANAAGAQVVLNLSPARPLDVGLATLLTVLVVNEHELGIAAGATLDAADDADLSAAADAFGVPALVVTCGSSGAAVVYGVGADRSIVRVPSPAVTAVDTTGCGDAFLGAIAAELAQDSTLLDAVRTAVLVGAYAATGAGAQPSYPTRAALEDWLR
ncbi:ribokinase [Leifsonia sp. NPDC102414]|uniref:ribokinase n=1 Tax=Leifsonia sp. NPDC102414 TaxID=3364124 RepID=UPI003806C3B4